MARSVRGFSCARRGRTGRPTGPQWSRDVGSVPLTCAFPNLDPRSVKLVWPPVGVTSVECFGQARGDGGNRTERTNATPVVGRCRVNKRGSSRGQATVIVVEPPTFATVVSKDDEDEQNHESGGWQREEIDGDQVLDMVVEEAPPRLGRWLSTPNHVLRHGGLGDRYSELREVRRASGVLPTVDRVGAADFSRSSSV